MNLNGSGDITKQQQLPNQVSSNSSLDSFLINLPSSSEHPLYMNIDDYGVQHSHTTDAEYELAAAAAAATGRSNASLADFDGSDQSSRAFAFDADEVDHLGDRIEGVESDHPPSAQQPDVPRPMHGRRVSAPAAMSSSMVGNSSVPEFLYQLTKMLTDDNRDVIEWAKGRIEVHSPQKLESHVLKKYFRHSKQLNYFGFRKLSGKGKMSPCAYVNETAMEDINSLFHIKRKSGGDQPDNQGKKRRDSGSKAARRETIPAVNPVLAGIYNRTAKTAAVVPEMRPESRGRAALPAPTITAALESQSSFSGAPTSAHQELARKAVGKGIRHEIGRPPTQSAVPPATKPPPQPDVPVASLNELASNYQNSLLDRNQSGLFDENDDDPTPLSRMQGRSGPYFDTYTGFLSRNSSLIDLAMIAPVEDSGFSTNEPAASAVAAAAPIVDASRGFGFIDFFPSSSPDQSDEPQK